ncbi:hypothetical protein B0T21DRAFT_21652 [Apiosordaria backusii]|uniref:Uncharacterized protein n=1 Tax=Apiosordaria backusii TaxID=314023 RepID=A0AA40EZG1_9PEZI|nr:hypothetical protein B0T21DRAFT_21652 [Apiosordaria backusii]
MSLLTFREGILELVNKERGITERHICLLFGEAFWQSLAKETALTGRQYCLARKEACWEWLEDGDLLRYFEG